MTPDRSNYLIDGYNLLHQIGSVRLKKGPGNLERARTALLMWISHRAADPSKVTVIFDAGIDSPSDVPTELWFNQVRVLFSRGFASADEMIIDECQHCRTPRQLVVVSDDHAVASSARRRRCDAWNCEDYIRYLTGQHPEASSPPLTPPTSIVSEPAAKHDGRVGIDLAYWRAYFGDDLELPVDDGRGSLPPVTEPPAPPPLPASMIPPPVKPIRALDAFDETFLRDMLMDDLDD